MNKAKLTNNTLKYATNFEKIGENWVSYPSDAQLLSAGFKEVVYKDVDEVINQYEETDTEIIVYVQKYIPSENETQQI